MDETTLFAAPHRRRKCSPASGCWSRLIVRSGPGRARWRAPPTNAARLRPDLLPLPRQQARRGAYNPDYTSTFVFDNDFAALRPDAPGRAHPRGCWGGPPLLHAESERGICRVVCFSPRHDLTLAGMESPRSARWWRRGSTSTPSWAHALGAPCADLREPRRDDGREQPAPARPDLGQRAAAQRAGTRNCASSGPTPRRTAAACSAITWRWKLQDGARLVCANEHFVALVPFWAVWPFETLVLPPRPMAAPARSDAARARRPGRHPAAADAALRQRCSRSASPIAWASTSAPRTARPTPSGTCTPTSTRRCCARRPCASSWSATSCWAQPQRDITAESAAERLRSLAVD